ncbi:chaperone protein DnaJ [Echria macrotheca]|uniref:Chaperone protein DnaJ n=1 Tax=Echria macrotheca TaxID=438768 RepID=A0AAJ0BA74_9PEZI|nr:chaperone protein DnaJ [Echria macrotheca]
MSGFLSLLGWSFLPNLVTGWTQSLYYSITIRAGDPRPQPGSPRFAEHRRRIHILVVTLYLLYTIYETDYDLQRQGTFYTDLSMPSSSTAQEIRSRFRRLAAIYHPDKISKDADPVAASEHYRHLQTAADTLIDPARRFAYERFGPDVVRWTHCTTLRDYMVRGAQVLVPYYAVAAGAMYGLGLLGYLDWGRFERWLVLAVVFVFELHAVTRPTYPAVLSRVINPVMAWAGGRAGYLPFQAVALARKLSVTVYIAFSQIGPLLAADTASGQVLVGGGRKGVSEEAALRQALDRLDAATTGLHADAARLLETEMAPYAGDDEMVARVRGKVKEWLVQNTIRSDPLVRDALGRGFQKRRVDAPAGARGTR